MVLQMVVNRTNASKLYNPNRDVAHCFPSLVGEVAKRLEVGAWKPLNEYLKSQGVTIQQVVYAAAAFEAFVACAVDDPKESMGDVMKRCGWFDAHPAAQVAVMAYYGTVMAGVFFQGAREATVDGQGPCLGLDDMRNAGRRAHELMAGITARTSRWRRFTNWLGNLFDGQNRK